MWRGEARGFARLKFSGSPNLNGERKIIKMNKNKNKMLIISFTTKEKENLILFSLV
jgi:hypothetical protein